MKIAFDEPLFRDASASSADAQSFVLGLIADWPHGQPFDALAVLEEHPELWRRSSAVLDLAYEEYRWLELAGRNVDCREFAAKFGSLADLVLEDLEALCAVEGDPETQRSLEQLYLPGPGDRVAGYELLAELGRGTFARVLLAREPALGHRQVVVKCCVDGRREARTLGPLQHPHIVPVYSTHWDEQCHLHVLCMPYLSRATLLDVIERGFGPGGERPPAGAQAILDVVADVNGETEFPSEPRRSARWWSGRSFVDGIVELATHVAEALAFVHQAGVCHGDIKPSNVLVTRDGRALLLDFNLAVPALMQAVHGGTLAYLSPEQLRALAARKSGRRSPATLPDNVRADVFALGATLYHVLTGRFPFGKPSDGLKQDEAVLDMLDRQRIEPTPVRALHPAVDARLSGVIHRCLALEPRDRPQTAAELVRLLRSHFDVPRRCRRWAAGHRALVACGSVLAAGLAVAVALGATGGGDGRNEGGAGGRARDRSFTAVMNASASESGLIDIGGSDRVADLRAAKADFEDGCRALKEERYEEAIACLDRALELDPAHLRARFVRGQALLLLGERYARDTDVARYRGDHEAARNARGRSSELLSKARADFEHVIQHRSDFALAKACAAYSQSRVLDPSQREAVIRLFEDGICAEFSREAAWNNIGFVHTEAGDLAAARMSFERALALNPHLAAAHVNLALTSVREALAMPQSRAELAGARIERLQRAVYHIQQAVALNPPTAGLWLEAAGIYARVCQESINAGAPVGEIAPILGAAVAAMQHAYDLGCAPQEIGRMTAVCDAIHSDGRVRVLLAQSGAHEPAPRPTRLISPLAGSSLPLDVASPRDK